MTNREVLDKGCKQRRIIIQRSRGRRDWNNLEAALMFVEQFLVNYPVASDERVREWCRKHAHQVASVLTPAMKAKYLQQLIG